MKELLSVIILSIFLFSFAVAPALAQTSGPQEGCGIPAGNKAGGWETIETGFPVALVPSVLFKKSDNILLFNTINAEERMLEGRMYAVLRTMPDNITTVSGAREGGYLVTSDDRFFMPQKAVLDQPDIGIKRGEDVPPNWAVFCLVNTINTIVNWIFTLILVVSVGLISAAGFMWITSGASPDIKKKATGLLTAAVIGIVIAILAKVIPALIVGILT